jgi:hypothetical protein
MERRVTKKIETYQVEFKNEVKNWLSTQGATVKSGNDDKTSVFLQFLFDFPALKLDKEDFLKRKRIKNIVPKYERCTSKRANGEQCTRRKKNGCEFCGTHTKGTPHGVMDKGISDDNKIKIKVEIWVQEIKGINYYIDTDNNVYKPEDIIQNSDTPQIIAKWICDENDNYSIPEFNTI